MVSDHIISFIDCLCLGTACVVTKDTVLHFTVSAVELNCLFTLRDLEKLESGTNLPVYSKLQPFAFDLKTKIGLGNLSEEQTYVYRALHGNADSIHTFIIRWIKSRNPNIEHTWVNLIHLLEEFGEKTFANELKCYLTFARGCATSKETSMEELSRLLKLICMPFLLVSCLTCLFYAERQDDPRAKN